ncbi:hypothetical protein PG593_04605 [Riemerella anatipestifer]|nr:hypothetical protein [Riemerella anatipestifer]
MLKDFRSWGQQEKLRKKGKKKGKFFLNFKSKEKKSMFLQVYFTYSNIKTPKNRGLDDTFLCFWSVFSQKN